MKLTTRRAGSAVLSVACVLAMAAGCASGGGGSSAGKPGKTPLTLMFGSSGTPETKAVQQAAAAFTRQSGIKVTVIAASNLQQQLAQGFAGNQPPDVFYLDPSDFQNYARDGVLDPYPGSMPNANDFYPVLKTTFSYKGQFLCVPKDFGPLALYVNTQDWTQAHLTTADVPANWSQLQSVARKLTTGARAGLSTDPSHSNLDAFFYQNGGTVFNSDQTKVELDSPQNVQALGFVKSLLAQGILKFPAQQGTSDDSESFGLNKAAMMISGPWIDGIMKTEYPGVKYRVYPLPAGPTGKRATLSFTNCWGVPKQSRNLAGAIELVKFLTTPAQQMTFAKAFGPIPSLTTDRSPWETAFPQDAVYLQEVPYAIPDIALPAGAQALMSFDSALAQLASSDPASVLKTAQQNLQGVLTQHQ